MFETYGMDEDERQLRIAEIRRRFPGRDVDSMLAGVLAGPADADRPDVAPWDYVAAAGGDAARLTELVAVRFPERFLTGEVTVRSIAECAQGGDFAPDGGPLEYIDLYRRLAAAGHVEWDSALRMVVHRTDFRTWKPVYVEWGAAHRDSGG